jgi:serine/threonine protein kinase
MQKNFPSNFNLTEPDSGLDPLPPETAMSLAPGTQMGEFQLTGVVGEGGFSIVYTALDHSLKRAVAIKEYMPMAIATRLPDGTVQPKLPKDKKIFDIGLASFLNEARLLAKFMHPALVHIYRILEQNGTAYIVMQYCVGQTLRQISHSAPDLVKNQEWLKDTFTPILDALDLLHVNNCLHRDISPDNIFILKNGVPVLLDFGAARQVIGGITRDLTVIVRPGFAPIEQYEQTDDPNLQQGPWTDIYGIGAVLYYLLIGKAPAASITRLVKDPVLKLVNVNELAGVSRSFRKAIDRAMAVYPNQRIQSVAELRKALRLPGFKPEMIHGNMSLSERSADLDVTSRKTISQDHAGNNIDAEPHETAAPPSSLASTDDFSSITCVENGIEDHTGEKGKPLESNALMLAASFTRRPSVRRNVTLTLISLGVLLVAVIGFGVLYKPIREISVQQPVAFSPAKPSNSSASLPAAPTPLPPQSTSSETTLVTLSPLSSVTLPPSGQTSVVPVIASPPHLQLQPQPAADKRTSLTKVRRRHKVLHKPSPAVVQPQIEPSPAAPQPFDPINPKNGS